MDADSEYDINPNKDAEQMMTLQSMIDVSAERLKGLRTQCLTSAELTQQEIRTLEGKLVKHFSCQLALKARCAELRRSDVPRLAQWLRVVGLSDDSIDAVCARVPTLEALRERSDRELRALLPQARDEEVRRLCRAMHRLGTYTEALARGEGGAELQLYWDSWERQRASPRAPRARPRTEPRLSESEHTTPDRRVRAVGKSVTEPIRKLTQQANCIPAPAALAKSRSHESQLAARGDATAADLSDTSQSSASGATGCSPPRSPEPAPPPQRPPPDRLHHNNVAAGGGTGGVPPAPRSPRTPTVSRCMAHDIAHRFVKHFSMIASCDYCEKQMLFGSGLKCKECKFKCHRDCESKVPPSCGLPLGYMQAFREKVDGGYYGPASPISARPSAGAGAGAGAGTGAGAGAGAGFGSARRRPHPPAGAAPLHAGGPDSSSNTSSCNSSCPSSPAPAPPAPAPAPAPAAAPAAPPPAPAPPAPAPPPARLRPHQFHFPEVQTPVSSPNHTAVQSPSSVAEQNKDQEVKSDGSRCVSLSGSGSTDSGGAVRGDSLDDPSNHNDARWPRQNSLSMKEWDIPYDELKLVEQIGTGRFGTVWRGSWHGAVAVKLLHVQALGDHAAPLDTFKHEVATFRKTRHENLVLFMGACMKPPKLAIVTSLCKGMTLHQHLQLRKDKFNPNKTVLVAQQIAQGMGYLHARGITHKDLKSKNIFLENGKVVITDFGLFSVTKLCFGNNARGDSVGIPQGWLCYLAPELVRSLRADASVHLGFSKATDVYAFGTVFYELLCCEWPFKGQPPEAVIWQVGKGVRQSLAHLQCTKDIKDMIMVCWSYHSTDRPDFAHLLSALEKFPRKRLARSPSHPVQLSRSADSVL